MTQRQVERGSEQHILERLLYLQARLVYERGEEDWGPELWWSDYQPEKVVWAGGAGMPVGQPSTHTP